MGNGKVVRVVEDVFCAHGPHDDTVDCLYPSPLYQGFSASGADVSPAVREPESDLNTAR